MPKLILTRTRILLILLVLAVLGLTLYLSQDIWLGKSQVFIQPHRALYTIRLSKLHQTNTLAAATGQMSYQIDDTCDGWNVAQKFNLVFVYTESPSALITSDYNTFESKDGHRYQFSTRRARDGEVTEEILGRAERDPISGGKVSYQKPKELEVKLPTNVAFPTQHTLELLHAALAGKKWFNSPIFDGSDLALSTDVNSFIHRINKPYISKIEEIVPIVEPVADPDQTVIEPVQEATNPSVKAMTAEELNNSSLIKGTRAWRIRMAFYSGPPAEGLADSDENSAEDAGADIEDPAVTPDYEMTMVIHSNGLVSQFTLDYSDFSLEARLLSVAEVAGNGC